MTRGENSKDLTALMGRTTIRQLMVNYSPLASPFTKRRRISGRWPG